MRHLTPAALIAAATIFTGCDDSRAPKLTAPAGCSGAFLPTTAKLDLGGPVFLYAETKGDPKRVADALLGFARLGAQQQGDAELMNKIPATLDPYLADLGLDNIEAYGVSSRFDGVGFVNKGFLYTPGGPKGLALAFGAENKPFAAARLAPADTLAIAEGVFAGDKLEAVVRAVAARALGAEDGKAKVDTLLATPVPNSPYTVGKILERLSGRAIVGLAVHRTELIPAGAVRVPAVDLTVVLENRAALFDELAALARMAGDKAKLAITEEGDLRVIAPTKAFPGPYARYSPRVALHKPTGRVFLTTSAATLAAWTAPTGRLAESADFRAASAGLAADGTGCTYVSAEFGDVARELFTTFAALMKTKEDRTALAMWQGIVEAATVKGAPGLYSASRLLPDGYYTESRSPYSQKPDAYLWAARTSAPALIMGGGLGAALAVPAFKKVRNNAIEKTLLNDARQIASGAAQQCTETGTTECRVKDIRDFLPSLSKGVQLGVADANGTYPLCDYTSAEADELVLKQGGKFLLQHSDYNRTMSDGVRIPYYQEGTGTDGILFKVDTAEVVR